MVRGGADQIEHVLERIAARVMREFVGERLHAKSVVDIRDRPEPSDSHVCFGGSVLDAEIGELNGMSVHPWPSAPAPP